MTPPLVHEEERFDMTPRVQEMLEKFNGRVSLSTEGRVFLGYDNSWPEADALPDPDVDPDSLDEPLTPEERKSLAEEMIRRWRVYGEWVSARDGT